MNSSTHTSCPESEQIGPYIALLKPKVMSLVVFSGIAGMCAAPGTLHPVIAVCAIIALTVGSGAAGAINMWADRDIDSLMKRTRTRPVPAGEIRPETALAFGLVLSAFAVLTMGVAVNWLAAGILAFASFFYSVIYTLWLKRRTPQNIVIGGAAGAFPPIIGWAAVTGDLGWTPLLMFLVIFLWTPPHFWALALFANQDYKDAGIPMLPVVAGERTTKRHILAYTILMLIPVQGLAVFAAMPVMYSAGALALNALFLLSAWQVFKAGEQSYKPAKRLFGYSVFYLFAWLGLVIGTF